MTILGIAGEAHRLTDEERRQVVDAVVKEVAGRVPVVGGVKNLDAVVEYYHAVADAARLPLVIQDEPVTTQVTMPAPFIARPVAEIPGAQAVKLEAAPTLPKITRLRALFERPVAIFGGLGGVYPPAAGLDPATLEELTEVLRACVGASE